MNWTRWIRTSRLPRRGVDYRTINPKGYVPALQLEEGEILTEGASVLQYLAGHYPEANLGAAAGSVENARLQEHLNYVASEFHKAFGPFFTADATEEDKKAAGERVVSKFNYLEGLFEDGRDYLLGSRFTVADAYMFVVANWTNFIGIDASQWPRMKAFMDRVAARPAAQRALAAEGLV